MRSSVEIIKERCAINDVIASYISVQQAGKNYKAKCPFHNEKTPSFFISPDRGSYYCFGCGAKGDIFSFVENFEGTDFLGALKILAERAGVTLSDNAKEKNDKNLLYEIMEEATKFFEANLLNYPEARAYLKTRGLSEKTIESFRIGYVKNEWRSLSDYLISKGYEKKDLDTVGLIKTKDSSFYDRFRGRIMFPISDSSGRVIAFSGRSFGVEKTATEQIEVAKYLNSPDTVLFNKSNVFFGIDKAKSAIRKMGYTIVVEGQMDLILSHQALFTNTVAVSGTALTDNLSDSNAKINNLGLIRRLASNVIFAFDGDEAGLRATDRSAMIALALDMQVKIAVLPAGKDPADIIQSNPDEWKKIIRNSVNIIDFHLNRICKDSSDMRIRGRKIREVIFPFLSQMQSSIEKSSYVSSIHSQTGLAEKSIIEDFESYEKTMGVKTVSPKPTLEEGVTNKNKSDSRRNSLEKRLFGILFWQSEAKDKVPDIDAAKDSLKENIGEESFKEMYRMYEPFADSLAFEAEMWYGNKIDDINRDLKEIILNLEEEVLNERQASLLNEINERENQGDKEKVKTLLEDYQKIVERIENIKSSRRE